MRKYRILVVVLIIGLAISISTYVKAVEISTREELIQFSEDVNSGNTFEGETIYLKNDIDLNGSEENQWIPIGSRNKPFKGTFEGNGHIVRGIYINKDMDSYENSGFFGYNEGKIQNIGTYGEITGGTYLAGICSENSGEIYQCYSNVKLTGESINVGGIVAWNRYGRYIWKNRIMLFYR